jgi:hypothetical protein
MSQPEKPSELIYLPAPTALPVIVAVGVALVVLGVFAWWPYAALGGILAIGAFIAWMRKNRTDIARMPREQEETPARIPLR